MFVDGLFVRFSQLEVVFQAFAKPVFFISTSYHQVFLWASSTLPHDILSLLWENITDVRSLETQNVAKKRWKRQPFSLDNSETVHKSVRLAREPYCEEGLSLFLVLRLFCDAVGLPFTLHGETGSSTFAQMVSENA